MPLTPKQQRFVDEYCVDLNATQAAIRAGYSPKTAGSQANRLLKNVNVAVAVARQQVRATEKVEVNQAWVLSKLVTNAEWAMRDERPTTVGLRALELIGKHLGMFVERQELTGKDGGPIETADTTDARAELLGRIRRFAERAAAGAVVRDPN